MATDEQYRKAARSLPNTEKDDIDVDRDATVSRAECTGSTPRIPGAWVQAWVWVYETDCEQQDAQGAMDRVNADWEEQPTTERKYTRDELVKHVKDHALEHYDTPGMGWDFLIECYSDKDIAELIEGARTPAGAIKKAKVMASAHGEQRAAAREDQ